MPGLLRSLWRARTYTLVSVATLGIVVGAAAAIFTIFDAVLLEPLPYSDPDRIVMVWIDNRAQGYPEDVTSYPSYLDLRAENDTLQDLAAYAHHVVHLTGDGAPERLAGAEVSASFFPLLGVEPLLGRYIRAEDEFVAPLDEVVLGYGLWNRRFGGDPAAVGRRVLLDGKPYTVVGIMPESFRVPDYHDFWVALAPDGDARTARQSFWLYTIGRLREGVRLEEARADLEVIMARIEEEHFPSTGEMGIVLNRLHDQWVRDVRGALVVLAASVLSLWLIACSNLSGIALARAGARQGELALRQSLGASSGRIASLLLAEGVVIGFLSLPLAGLVATTALKAFESAVESRIAGVPSADWGWNVVLVSGVMALLSGLLFHLAPVIHSSSRDLVSRLKKSGFSGASRHRTRRALVVSQIALSLVLLVGALLLVRSFLELQRVPVGFDAEGASSLPLTLRPPGYPEPSRRAQFYERLVERVAAVPGVESVAAVSSVLHGVLSSAAIFTVEGVPVDPNDTEAALFTRATPGYFGTMRIPIVDGRDFDASDDADGAPVVIVNETMAKQYWPGLSPVGRRMAFGIEHEGEPEWLTVVGVVGDIRQIGLDRAVRLQTFVPLRQSPGSTMELVIRSRLEVPSLFEPIREAIWQMDPELPVASLTPVQQALDERLGDRRRSTFVVGLFAASAVFLSAIGVYGVLAYSVSQRTGELGLRAALGAGKRDLVALVLGEGVLLVALGLAIGMVAVVPLRGLTAGLLFGVGPFDPPALLVACGLLSAAAFLACFLPARRAARIDPSLALRHG
jgi:putative ABC transport system permease protein